MVTSRNIPRSRSDSAFTWKIILPMALIDAALIALFVMEKITMPMLVGSIVATGIFLNIFTIIGRRIARSGLTSGGVTGSAEILSTSVLGIATNYSPIDFHLNVRIPGRPTYQVLHSDVVRAPVAEMIKQGKLKELVISANRKDPLAIRIEWDRFAPAGNLPGTERRRPAHGDVIQFRERSRIQRGRPLQRHYGERDTAPFRPFES